MTRPLPLPFLFLLGFLLLSQPPAEAQYTFTNSRDITLSAVGGALLTAGFHLTGRVDPLSQEEWASLNRNQVWAFDRPATYNNSTAARTFSDCLVFSSVLLPLTFLANPNTEDEFGGIGLMTLQGLAITMGLTNISKGSFKRKRPYNYNHEDFAWPTVQQKGSKARISFFSGHTSITACMTFMGARMHNDFFPNSNSKTWIWTGAVVIPAITGWLRTEAGKHYYTDVLVGYGVGALIGLLIPTLHK